MGSCRIRKVKQKKELLVSGDHGGFERSFFVTKGVLGF
jgi:hypothetical protein